MHNHSDGHTTLCIKCIIVSPWLFGNAPAIVHDDSHILEACVSVGSSRDIETPHHVAGAERGF
jgi:hypothetical protein